MDIFREKDCYIITSISRVHNDYTICALVDIDSRVMQSIRRGKSHSHTHDIVQVLLLSRTCIS